jgi:hypothetical protein
MNQPQPEDSPLSYAQIEGYWIAAGGDPTMAPIMAAISFAESSGIPNRLQEGEPYKFTGWGLWQITSGDSESDIGTNEQLFDPLTNAKAAVAKYDSQGLSAWATYTSGAFNQFYQKGVKPVIPTGSSTRYATPSTPTPVTRPGGQPVNGKDPSKPDITDALSGYVQLRDMPRTAPPGTKNPFQWWVASFTGNWDSLGGAGQGES